MYMQYVDTGVVVDAIKVDGKNKRHEPEVWEDVRSFKTDENNNLILYDADGKFLYEYHSYNWAGIGPWPTNE